MRKHGKRTKKYMSRSDRYLQLQAAKKYMSRSDRYLQLQAATNNNGSSFSMTNQWKKLKEEIEATFL